MLIELAGRQIDKRKGRRLAQMTGKNELPPSGPVSVRVQCKPEKGSESVNAFPRFMASPTGRWLRIGAGAALIAGGLLMGGAGGIIIAVVGIAPLAAGASDRCLFAPAFRAPFKGRDIRERRDQ